MAVNGREIALKEETKARSVKTDETKKSNNFFSGVLVLSLSAVIVKIIGLVYKIPMLRLLGSEGMGYFNSAYEIYALFCVISTAGLPVAMSVMISRSGERRMAHKIFKVAVSLFLVLGIIGSLVMFLCAEPFAMLLKSSKAVYSIMAIAPTVLFICISSAYRGYFQGLGTMMPTAVSQVIEALGKLFIGLLFAHIAFGAGFDAEMVAAFAVMGLTLGTAISALYLALSKKIKDSHETPVIQSKGGGRIAAELMRTAVPVTLSSAVISLTKVIDMTMILRRMQTVGFSENQAFSAYGNYTTLAVPLFSVAPALISSVALPLVPALSSAIAAKDAIGQVKATSDAVKLALIVSMPISLGLSVFSKPILSLIFPREPEAVTMSAPLLSVLGLSVAMSCLITVSNSVLQAYGRPTVPIRSMAAGTTVKIILAYFLIGNREVNIMGAPISTLFCDLTIVIINLYYVNKYLPAPLSAKDLMWRPFGASLVAVGTARALYCALESRLGESPLLTIASVGVAAAMYLPMCVLTRAINREDIKKFIGTRVLKSRSRACE